MMKAGRVIAAFALIGLLAWAGTGSADQNARQFLAGLEAYKAGDYEKAAGLFEALATGGLVNGKLFYNLGNAYLKNGDLGRAVLWYERALQLLPKDPDLRFNYEYARSLTKDVPEQETTPLVRIFFFWKYQLSPMTIILLAIAANLAFWTLAAARAVTRRPGLRRAALVVLVPALVFILTAGYNYYERAHIKEAIVLPAQVSVRSGLQASSTELFKLHAGARVRVVKAMKGYYQIRYAADKIGWVPRDEVGVI